MFTAALLAIAKTRKQPECPSTDEWMKNMVYLYMPQLLYSMKHYSAIKKNGSNNMNGPRDNQTQWSNSERKRQIPYDITYMLTLNYKTNEHIYETETDSQTQREG